MYEREEFELMDENRDIEMYEYTINYLKENGYNQAYSLILEEGTELFDMYEREEFELMDENRDIEMYEYTINYLKENGYNQYEISNYSKKGKEICMRGKSLNLWTKIEI